MNGSKGSDGIQILAIPPCGGGVMFGYWLNLTSACSTITALSRPWLLTKVNSVTPSLNRNDWGNAVSETTLKVYRHFMDVLR